MKNVFLTFGLVLTASSAHAGQTQWFDIAPDTQLRMVFSDSLSLDNYTMMAFELDMPAGTKTYWRVPGETGIPWQIDYTQSEGVEDPQLIWPFPEREISFGYMDYVYHQHLVLPIKAQITELTPHLEFRLTLGICSDICIPVSVDISHTLSFEQPDASVSLKIAQAVAETPIPWEGSDIVFGAALYDESAARIELEMVHSDFDVDSMIATIGDTFIIFGAPQKSPIGNLVTFDKLGGSDIAQLVAKGLTITFMSPDGPYEISMPLDLK